MAEDAPLPDFRAPIPVREARLPEPPPPPDRCPYCRSLITIGTSVCNACGRRLREDPPRTPIRDAPWTPTDCPRCGRPTVPGLLSGSDGNGEIWVHLLLEYFPVSGSDGVAGPVNDVVIARPLGRKVVKDRAKWPRWHWCASCRLLHYPEPAPG